MKGIRAAVLAAVAALTLCACGQTPETATIFAMNTVMTLEASGGDSRGAVEAAIDRINGLDRLLAVTGEDSDVRAVNTADGTVELSADTAALVDAGLDLWERTGGALNIALYPVVRAWGFTTGDYRVVPEGERQELLALTDPMGLHFDRAAGTVTPDAGMEIDLGSLGKGYAGDQVMAIFREHGVESACISLGGNVHTLGSRPDGQAWHIAVRDPEDDAKALGMLEVRDVAVVTSGGYERYFEEDGAVYWHIMDPATGAPADSGLISATVVGESGTLCDGLSTALFVMGAEKAEAFWRANGGFDFLLVGADGALYLTAGLAEIFTPAADLGDRAVRVIEP